MRYLKMTTDKNYSFSAKWSPRLAADGFTTIPNALIRNQAKLGINSSELVVILCLASHKWDHQMPFPAVSSLCRYTGKSDGAIRGILRTLDSKGFIRRIYRDNQTSKYDLKPLVRILDGYTQPTKKSTPPGQKLDTQDYQKNNTNKYAFKNNKRSRNSSHSGKPSLLGDIAQSRINQYGQ